MLSVLGTNLTSLFAQRTMQKNHDAFQTSIQRLSSGVRINSAKDDASGSSISEYMTANINGIHQATRNANDGLSLTQTAESGLSDIANSLQRLRTLAVQSANATNTKLDRAALQEEARQVTESIDQVATQINFNGIKLLDGSFKKRQFQVGPAINQTIGVEMGNVRVTKLGTSDVTSISSTQKFLSSAGADDSEVKITIGDLIINGVQINGAMVEDDISSSAKKNLSSIAKAAAINKMSKLTGVTATVNENVTRGVAMTANPGAGVSASFLINGVTITATTTTNSAVTRQVVVEAINSKRGRTGILAVNSGSDIEGITLKASDGRNIDVSASIDSVATGVKSGLFMGSYTLVSNSTIHLEEGLGNIAHAGFVKGNYDAQTAYVSNAAISDSGTDDLGNKSSRAIAFQDGDFRINGMLTDASREVDDRLSSYNKAASAIAKAAVINRIASATGVTATANATEARGFSGGMISAIASGKLSINGVVTEAITTTILSTTATARRDTANAINKIAQRTGVKAFDSGTTTHGVKLIAQDGRNIIISSDGGLTEAITGLGSVQNSYYGAITLSSSKAFTISAGKNNNTDLPTTSITNGLDHLGIGTGSYGGARTGLTLAEIDLSTHDGATNAISAVDNAIDSINLHRASLGALQQRFSSAINNLENTGHNLSSARSQIHDTNLARETAVLTRSQILQRSSSAILSQANAQPDQVMVLLSRY